jgi:hypothetical protein
MIKDMLTERVIAACTQAADAVAMLDAVAAARVRVDAPLEPLIAALTGACLRNDRRRAAQLWPALRRKIALRQLLYVPLHRGGQPLPIVRARSLHRSIDRLLGWMPRLGLFVETVELIQAVRDMEANHPVGPAAVTEFDRLFETGYTAIVECIVLASESWSVPDEGDELIARAGPLVELLQQATEVLLSEWLGHSSTLRLSVLEKIDSERRWKALVAFIKRFGAELFTQYFLNPGSLRSILHQGVDRWLDEAAEEPDHPAGALIYHLTDPSKRTAAVDHLTLVLEAIVENYGEYRDYNSTTTQSDRGDLLYTLLDFVRLRVDYDQVAWKLRPVVIAHAVMVRRGLTEASAMWRRALIARTGDVAEKFLKRLARLEKKHGMRLPTVGDRVAERFIRPLATDRARALIRIAMQEIRSGKPPTAFEQLESLAADMTQQPTGVGLDVPDWIIALEEEVDEARDQLRGDVSPDEDVSIVPNLLSRDQIQDQLDRLSEESDAT